MGPQKGKKANFKKERRSNKKEKGREKKAFATASVAGVTGSPRATAAAAPRALLSGMLSPEEEWRWRRCSAGNSPLCRVLLRRLLGCESGGDRALEAELRAWKSLGGPGDSALRLACLFTCAANSPRALPALPGADPESGRLGPPLAGCRPDCCNWEDQRAARLQSEWAAEMY